MAWTTPRTWVVNELVTAALMNAHVRDNLAYLKDEYNTTLPASPFDGQYAVLVNSLTSPAYVWRFRYNAGSSSAYKWEFVGGTDAQTFIATAESRAAAGYGDLATYGPNYTAPRAGEYALLASATVQKGTAAAAVFDASFRVYLETSATSLNPVAYFRGIGNVTGTVASRILAEVMPATMLLGESAKIVYSSSILTADVVFFDRRIQMRPIRVS